MHNKSLWERYKKYLCVSPSLGMMLDISRVDFPAKYFDTMEPEMQKAYRAMDDLEAGAVANPDEQRMVGHYWLRSPERAPSAEIRKEIEAAIHAVKDFASAVHGGTIRPEKRPRFTRLLIIGVGGSALGPQFIADALGTPADKMKPCFLDNTDPNGFDRLFTELGADLAETLTLVISKSGGTVETRNGMVEAAEAYRKAGLAFEKHAVAVTGVGSKLDDIAKNGSWLARFPMWDWVGGRTSVTSAVGLLPAALQGLYIEGLLKGAALCDEVTRSKDTRSNPAGLLAMAWYHATSGQGKKDMVILPYKDRLQLFPRYLQQLVMESLGKEQDLKGRTVNQGIAVYGNKGSTDQHAYIQQLREGVNNFFVTFIEVLNDREGRSIEVEPGVTSGDYLSSFLLGTRNALYENGRESITITMEKLDAQSVGVLIALYERAVGLYATLINVNAYHQPGVEAGKKMAGAIIHLQLDVIAYLRKHPGASFTAQEIAKALNAEDRVETAFRVLEHLAANHELNVVKIPAENIVDSRYEAVAI
jgi:glucose-6-phosphate isomerase